MQSISFNDKVYGYNFFFETILILGDILLTLILKIGWRKEKWMEGMTFFFFKGT